MSRFLAIFLASSALVACAPIVRPPSPGAALPQLEQWQDTPAASSGVVTADWWRQLGDPAIGALVDRALANNTDVLTAVSKVEEAEAATRLARAGRLPSLDANGSATSQRALSQVTGTGEKSFTVQPQLSANWNLDLSGRVRALEGARRAQYQASQADRDATRLLVTASTVRAYVSLLSLDAQLTVSRNTLASRSEALRIARDQYSTGYSSEFELTQSQSEYEAIAQTIPRLEQARRVQENALRLLVGDPPGEIVRGALADTRVPVVPLSLPSELLRRRPDIGAAELRLVAADGAIAARRAEFLPDVQLSASAGALLVDGLDYDPVGIWSLGGSLLAPIFHGGALRADLDTSVAQRDQAAFAYRATVLTALQEVDNALSGERTSRERFEAALRRRTILQRSLTLATDRYRGGYAAYLEQLDAQRNLYQAELEAITVREEQLNNLVTLWAALGGGWPAG